MYVKRVSTSPINVLTFAQKYEVDITLISQKYNQQSSNIYSYINGTSKCDIII